ncbi:MAG: MFS transporter [Pseudomonadales bacterium]|nr:MFS transporter [Pseudomonadales bacterium]
MATRALSFGTKFAFGVGQMAEGIKNSAFATFLLIYYNQVLGLPGSLAGLAIMIALCFDAITDPLAGSLSDNLRSRWGRRHPFMYASAVPLALFFYLLFVPPAGLDQWGLFAWLTVLAVLTRGAMTLYHVPHLALGAELTEEYEERTSIVSFRQVFGILGTLATVVLGFTVFFADRGELKGNLVAEAYPPFALTFAVVMCVTILWSGWGTHDQIPHLSVPAAPERRLTVVEMLVRVFTDLAAAVTNHSFRWLFAGVIIVFVMVGVQSALNLYMANYFWEFSSTDLLWVSLAPPLGMLIGAPFTRLINRRFDKRPSLVLGTAWYAVFQLSPPILRLAGLFPENGDPLLAPLITVMYVIGGAGVVQALVTAGSMMADIADEHELGSGRRQEGIFFGALSFSGKAASGVGNLIGGVALDLIDFPDAAVPGEVAEAVLTRLGLTYGPVVMGFAVIAVWCYTHYRLTRTRHEEILAELARRRAARVAEAAAT